MVDELEKYLTLEEIEHQTRLKNQEIHWIKMDSGAAPSCRQNLHPLLAALPLHRPRPTFRLKRSLWCVCLQENQSVCVPHGFSVPDPCRALKRSKKSMVDAQCAPPFQDLVSLPPVGPRYLDLHSLHERSHHDGDSIPFLPH